MTKETTNSKLAVLIDAAMLGNEDGRIPDGGISITETDRRTLFALLADAASEETSFIKRGIRSTLKVGQVEASLIRLAGRLDCDRKTVRKSLNKLESLGMIRRNSDRLTTIIDMACLVGWFTPNGFVPNPLSSLKVDLPNESSNLTAEL